MVHMTENAQVFYSKPGGLVNRSINFGSKYAPGECKSLYGIEHDGTCLGAAQAYYNTLEAISAHTNYPARSHIHMQTQTSGTAQHTERQQA